MRQWLSLFLIPFTALPAFSREAASALDDHRNISGSLVIEHAEVLMPSSGSGMATAYLAIWNGTEVGVHLTSVTSEGFGDVQVYRGLYGKGQQPAGVISIPGHAELLMRETGTYLALVDRRIDLRETKSIPLEVTFNGRDSITVNAAIVSSSEELTNHRHGEGDVTSR